LIVFLAAPEIPFLLSSEKTFDGPPTKSPFDHRQPIYNEKKNKKTFERKKVINSNWIHDRLEVIEFLPAEPRNG